MVGDMSTITRKHIDISIKIKQIAATHFEQFCTYLATYTTGTAGQDYQRIEEESGEEFWSIRAWTLPPHHRLKDPDVILTYDKQVSFIVEVKWGTIPGYNNTDLLISPQECLKMERLFVEPFMCRVRGPAVENGHRYRSSDFHLQKDYFTDTNTKMILVSDFRTLGQVQLNEFLRLWRKQKPGFVIADIDTRVKGIPSFREVVEGKL